MKNKLEEALNSVKDEKSFLNFLQVLMEDRIDEIEKVKLNPSSPYDPGINGWENTTIEDFLESAVVWGEGSIDGLEFYKKPENTWKRVADIMYMGKLYE
jgi:hypothetical protein